MNGHARTGDGFGSSLATGDFNNDGYDDLAIGIPGRYISGHAAAGAVTILFGSRHGLRAVGDQQWSQDSLGINSHARANENFGSALAVGDFDNDRYDDLAIGTPGESTAGVAQAGVVNVIFGSRSGLKRSQDQIVRHRDKFFYDMPGHRTDSKFFGSVLATGDFNGDGHDDLAISMRERISVLSPPPDASDSPIAGGVDIFHGVEHGIEIAVAANLEPTGELAPNNLLDPDAADYFFGAALAVGDFDGSGTDDLAVGVPGELTEVHDEGGILLATYVGAVRVFYSDESGIHPFPGEREQTLTPKDFNFSAATDEGFGRSLAAGHFDSVWHENPPPSTNNDLAIGSELANVNGHLQAGKVAIVYGGFGFQIAGVSSAKAALNTSGSLSGTKYTWHQDVFGIVDAPEAGDRFGASLIAGDFDGNGHSDLAIGVPGENSVGATAILYGYPMDLVFTGAILPPEWIGPSVGLKRNNNQLWLYDPSMIVRD